MVNVIIACSTLKSSFRVSSSLLLLVLCVDGAPRSSAHTLSFRSIRSLQQQPGQAQIATKNIEVVTLAPGQRVEGELSGEQEHSYEITMAEGQYASVVVQQRGIDVVVQLIGEDDKSILEVDNEWRFQGEEKIEWV